MESIPFWLPVVFFAIAVIYSTVGFGGGSSYLAVLALLGLPYASIPPTALACNLVVAAGGVWHFHRHGQLDIKRVAPFIVASIPMSFVGGRVPVDRQVFLVLLGASLFVAAARMFVPTDRVGVLTDIEGRRSWIVGLAVGAALGFLSGLVGIGGGIFLAPVLILTGWGDARRTAGAAALFILVNSAAGLAGQLDKGSSLTLMVVPLLLAVFVGGQIGSRLGSYRLSVARIRHGLAVLILVVSVRVMWSAF